ncbi:MAG: CapA family protein [Ruminococcus sp.]|nr:CapA family protein [Ruminococcus sp.]
MDLKKTVCRVLSFLIISALLTSCGKEADTPHNSDSIDKRNFISSDEDDIDNIISFVGVGDNLIHESIYEEADKYAGSVNDGQYDFTPMYSEVKNLIEGNDIAFVNQETILGGYNLGLSGYPTFNSPSEIAQNLKATGFNLVNMATNHALDKGQEGINNELNAFRNAEDMVFAGIADCQNTYDNITVFEKKGVKFAFLAYTYGTNGINPPNSYSIHYFNEEEIISDIKKAKELSDVVIVSAHWGEENIDYATDYQTYYAQIFADAGVDVVIGTHPHVIQPIEWYDGVNGNKTLVVYSLGNFLGGMLEVNNIVSGMVKFDFVKSDNEIAVKNVKWTPLVIHFELNGKDIQEDRFNYKIYPLSEYSNELAKKHALNGYEGQAVTINYIKKHTEEIIAKEYL